jgi:hypothetical protein
MPLLVGDRLARSVRRRPALSFAIGHAFLLAVLFADPLFPRRSFTGRDLLPFFLPVEKAVHESWRSGRIPLWMPEISFGKPLAANPNMGVFYPPRIAMAALPFRVSFKLYPIFHLWLAGLGAYALARFLGSSAGGAVMAGITYALCGPAVSDLAYPNIIGGLTLLPLVVFAAGRFARKPSARRAAAFAALWGIDLLAGDVFTAGLALCGAALIAFQESQGPMRVKVAGALGGAALLGVLSASIQVVPAIDLAPLTIRSLGRFPLRFAAMWSTSPWRLLEFFVPFPFGNAVESPVVWGDGLWSGKSTGFFLTLSAGAFAAHSVLFHLAPKGRRLFLYGFGGLSLLLACSGRWLPASAAESSSPIPLRYPEKLMIGAALSIALTAAFAFDRLNRSGGRKWSLPAALVASLLLGGSLLSTRLPRPTAAFIDRHWSVFFHLGAAGARRLPGILTASALWWAALAGLLYLWVPPRRRWLSALLVLFVVADLASTLHSLKETDPDRLVHSPPPSARILRPILRSPAYGYMPLVDFLRPAPTGSRDAYRPGADVIRGGLSGDTAASYGLFQSFNQDYDVSDFYRVELARREVTRDGGTRPALPSYLAAFSARAAILGAGRVPVGFPRPGPTIPPDWIVENPAALPTIRFAGAVEEVASVSEAYRRIHDEGADLSSLTVVETGERRRWLGGHGRIRVGRWEAGRLELEARAATPALLVLVLAYSPFRQIQVDGRRALFYPADLCLTALPLPEGDHRISVIEKLPGGSFGPALTACGLIGVLLLFASGRGEY